MLVVTICMNDDVIKTWNKYEKKFKREALINQIDASLIDVCLSYAHQLHMQKLPIIYCGAHFSDLVGYKTDYIYGATNSPEHFYRSYKIPKRNGKSRKITEPLPSLKEIQSWILVNILENIPVHPAAKAYQKGLSIHDNARFHRSQELVLKIDIKNFFPSITPRFINATFKRLGYSKEVSKLLTELVIYKNGLPQGAPTSPALSNLIMYKIDKRVFAYARSKNLRYTRYADDLTISGDFNVKEVISFATTILKEYGFQVNTDKTRVLRKSNRQIVTGVVCNEKLQAPKEVRRALRKEIYYIKTYGLDSHIKYIDNSKRNYVENLMGRANYILQLNPYDKDALEVLRYFRKKDNTY